MATSKSQNHLEPGIQPTTPVSQSIPTQNGADDDPSTSQDSTKFNSRKGKSKKLERRGIDRIVKDSWNIDGHLVNESTRMGVELMACGGLPVAAIAMVMRMEVADLKLIYEAELDRGGWTASANVVLALYQNAMQGNVAAQIFWTKARLGWSETTVVRHEGRQNPRTMSKDDLRAYLEAKPGRPSEDPKALVAEAGKPVCEGPEDGDAGDGGVSNASSD